MKTFQSSFRALAAISVLALTAAGTASAYEVARDVLEEGQFITYRAHLHAGETFTYYVEAERAALDVDLEVFDPHGELIASDYDEDAEPVAHFHTHCGGTYLIRVRMVDTWRGVPVFFTLHQD